MVGESEKSVWNSGDVVVKLHDTILQPGESANLCSADWSGLCTDTEPRLKRLYLSERHACEMLPSLASAHSLAHIMNSVCLQTNIADTDWTTQTRSRHSLTLQAPLNFTSADSKQRRQGEEVSTSVLMCFRILISRLIYIISLIPFILVYFILLNTLLVITKYPLASVLAGAN